MTEQSRMTCSSLMKVFFLPAHIKHQHSIRFLFVVMAISELAHERAIGGSWCLEVSIRFKCLKMSENEMPPRLKNLVAPRTKSQACPRKKPKNLTRESKLCFD
jgi:hypothetical protein